ncbi:MAG: tetratricopeptide repeat protein [Treponema sp.]|nr:tetratricopeptide repeat protein [Treponema sp.]
MKKILCMIPALALFISHAAGENQNLSAQMRSSYESGFYPGVVRYAEEILRTEKDSLASFRAAVYEGECLFKMGRIKDARKILESHRMNGDNLNPETIELNSSRFYWLGRIELSEKKHEKASVCFFNSASVFQELEKISPKTAASAFDYYSFSMLYGAQAYYERQMFAEAVPLYEYVISNGAKFSVGDYSDSALSLVRCYKELADKKNAQKCLSVISALENGPFDTDTKSQLFFFKGYAYEKLGDKKKANEAYRKAGAKEKLAETSLLLAVESFEAKDYGSALFYLDDASPVAFSEQKKIIALYRAEIAYESESDKNDGSRKAIEILRQILKSEKFGKPENASRDEPVFISLARYNAYLKNWKECESYASGCQKSANPEIAGAAVYWIALAKYESGDIAKAVSVIDAYKKTHLLEDSSLLNLYAKALAKQGKYHDADAVFYSLGEKNQLDNDGRLDYSRTLLIAGHYVSTKEQAAKANGDEAVYLSALASFNQHRWKEAEDSFERLLASKNLDREYIAYAQFYLAYSYYQSGNYEKTAAGMKTFIGANPLHPFVWSAYMTLSRSSTFLKKTDEALSAAEKAVQTGRTEAEKHEALLLSAGIMADAGLYDKALKSLRPYIAQKSEFGYECKYRSAEILLQQGNPATADTYFSELAALTDKKAALLAEESAYRRAELAYSAQDFVKSAELFEWYTKHFADGKFYYAAIYFSADCLARIGEETRAILRYEQITDSSAETSYRYGAEKNLVALYEKSGDYGSALAMAERMVSEYGKQAVNDGLADKAGELRKRSTDSSQSLEEQIKTAERNLAQNKKNSSQVSQNLRDSLFLAGAYRSKGENKKSAELYLEAAKYARQAGDDEHAARSFYGALESFDAAALYGDAKATFTELKRLYPDSKYTKDGEKIASQF